MAKQKRVALAASLHSDVKPLDAVAAATLYDYGGRAEAPNHHPTEFQYRL